MKAQAASPILTLTFSQLEKRCPRPTTKLNNEESMTSPGPLSTPVFSLPGVEPARICGVSPGPLQGWQYFMPAPGSPLSPSSIYS